MRFAARNSGAVENSLKCLNRKERTLYFFKIKFTYNVKKLSDKRKDEKWPKAESRNPRPETESRKV